MRFNTQRKKNISCFIQNPLHAADQGDSPLPLVAERGVTRTTSSQEIRVGIIINVLREHYYYTANVYSIE